LGSVADELYPYVSLDNIMDSITLHSSMMFADLAQSLCWNNTPTNTGRFVAVSGDGKTAAVKPGAEAAQGWPGQATVISKREFRHMELHSWIICIDEVSLPVCSDSAGAVVTIPPPAWRVAPNACCNTPGACCNV
jgi:hypothetical protein